MKSIWLDSNRLSGTLPSELGSLAELEEVLIGNNEFEGRVPDTFLSLDLKEFEWHNNPLCLPNTPAFRAWRGRIQTAVGPYCAASATTAAEGSGGHRTIATTISVEPPARCTALSGSRITETGKPKHDGHDVVWTGAHGEVIRDASIGCPSHQPDPP